MAQTDKINYRNSESVGHAFSHSCLGRLVMLIGALVVLAILAIMTKPSREQMEEETADNVLQCIGANDSIRGDKIDDAVNNLAFAFSKADTASINKELRVSLNKNNRLEVYNHTCFRTAYIFNNIYPDGVRVGFGLFGLVIPTVTYDDLLLNVGPMQKHYKDGVIRSTVIDSHDLGTNPNIKEFHYKGNPDD